MDWILDHLQIVIAIAAAFAYWLNQRRQTAAPEDDAEAAPTRRDMQSDPEEAARTRRIQEEIRRKIAERAGGGPRSGPLPVPEPPPLPQRGYYREAEPPPSAQPEFQASSAEVLERQLELAEQLQVLETARRLASRKAAAVVAQAAQQAPSPARSALMTELRGPRNLRRAMVLREVLGPPMALR